MERLRLLLGTPSEFDDAWHEVHDAPLRREIEALIERFLSETSAE